jgi:hypothetical protein
MKLKPSFVQNKKGLETITAVFMLMLMFAMILGVVFTFQTYNTTMQHQSATNLDRSKESLTLTKQINLATNEITSINIINTGTAEAKIRAIYITTSDGTTTFLDPSASLNTVISPNHILTISSSVLSSSSLSSDTRIIASTETGVKAVEAAQPTPTPTPGPTPDPDLLTYGSLMLHFSGFMYRDIKDADIPANWHPGWEAPAKISCEWKVTVTNVGKKDLTITQTSCFTVKGDSSSSIKKWTLDNAPIDLLKRNPSDHPVVMKFVNPAENLYSSGTMCTTFLTFYGHFTDNSSPYAQTIPFEAFAIT